MLVSRKKLFAIGAVVALAMSFSIGAKADGVLVSDLTDISPEPAKLKLVRTNCVHKVTGEIVAYSNDCAPGTVDCIDNTCP